MTSQLSPTGGAETPTMLFFNGKPIRIVVFEAGGVPHFSLQDLCEAMGWGERATTAQVNSVLFPAHGKRTAVETGPEGVADVTVLTPVGVFYLTDLTGAAKGQSLAAWAKREARKLCPNAPAGDPAMYLTLSPGNRRPPRPLKYSGWLAEWLVLQSAGNSIGAHNPMRELQELAINRAWDARIGHLKAARETEEGSAA